MENNQIYCSSCGAANQIEANYCHKCGKKIAIIPTPNTNVQNTDFITLQCPNCGGKLQVGNEIHRLTCQFCGLEHLVRKDEGAISLAPIVDSINKVAGKFDQVLSGSDRMAAEQTIKRLKTEMPEYENRMRICQEKYNREVNRKPSKFGKIILNLVSILCMIWILLVIIGILFTSDEPVPPEVIVTVIIAVFLLVLSRIGIRAMKKKADNSEIILSLRNELDKVQKEYQERKNQLDQLHRYTAER